MSEGSFDDLFTSEVKEEQLKKPARQDKVVDLKVVNLQPATRLNMLFQEDFDKERERRERVEKDFKLLTSKYNELRNDFFSLKEENKKLKIQSKKEKRTVSDYISDLRVSSNVFAGKIVQRCFGNRSKIAKYRERNNNRYFTLFTWTINWLKDENYL